MNRNRNSYPGKQRGAALYVALIMLVLLALIGVIGLQVAGMQERMSADYRITNMAFQRTEGLARETESEVAEAVEQSIGANRFDENNCFQEYVASDWAAQVADTQAVHVRRIDMCMPGGSPLEIGLLDASNRIYQITAYNEDAGGTSAAVVDTVYIP